jgi:hypothetical protein
MIMPEYGLSPNVGKAIGSHSGAKALVNRYRPFIRRERIRALSELAEAGFQQLVDAIRKETYGVNSLLGIGAQHFIEFDASFWEDPDEK